jgi:hypothetical protein
LHGRAAAPYDRLVERWALLALLVAGSGCARAPLELPVDAAQPPDLDRTCGDVGPCPSGQVCVYPCMDLVYCYPPAPDGGCGPGDYVAPCYVDFGLACTFDLRPKCIDVPSACASAPSCATCGQAVCGQRRCAPHGSGIWCPCP